MPFASFSILDPSRSAPLWNAIGSRRRSRQSFRSVRRRSHGRHPRARLRRPTPLGCFAGHGSSGRSTGTSTTRRSGIEAGEGRILLLAPSWESTARRRQIPIAGEIHAFRVLTGISGPVHRESSHETVTVRVVRVSSISSTSTRRSTRTAPTAPPSVRRQPEPRSRMPGPKTTSTSRGTANSRNSSPPALIDHLGQKAVSQNRTSRVLRRSARRGHLTVVRRRDGPTRCGEACTFSLLSTLDGLGAHVSNSCYCRGAGEELRS